MKQTLLLPIYVVLLLGFGCNTEPCDFNIDKIEIMARINIPKLTDNFHCNKVGNVQITCIEFDSLALEKSTMLNLVDYAERYEFEISNVLEGQGGLNITYSGGKLNLDATNGSVALLA